MCIRDSYGAVVLLLIGIGLDHYPVALVGFFVLCTATGSSLWNRFALDQVIFETSLSAHRAFPDDRVELHVTLANDCLLYTSPSPRDRTRARMPSSAWKKKNVAVYDVTTGSVEL